MLFRISILALFLAVPVGETPAQAGNLQERGSNFYTIRRDVRRCASPMCGGYFIRPVNQSRMRCANGRNMRECYVATIEWGSLSQPERDGALVRGAFSTRGDRRGRFGVLHAREVWLPASTTQPSGTFYRVRDRGIRCVAAPCETHREMKLNTSVSRNIAGVDLSGTGAPENAVSEALAAMAAPDGVIVAGVHTRVTGPAGRSQMLKGRQFYQRAGSGGTSSGGDQNKPCFKTGCSGQVCADEEVVTTCEWRAEYECYRTAKCERQANGKCGFTDTPELRRCLRRN